MSGICGSVDHYCAQFLPRSCTGNNAGLAIGNVSSFIHTVWAFGALCYLRYASIWMATAPVEAAGRAVAMGDPECLVCAFHLYSLRSSYCASMCDMSTTTTMVTTMDIRAMDIRAMDNTLFIKCW